MSEKTKQELMQLAAHDLEQLLIVIGELGFTGYKIALMRLRGASLGQCALKLRVSKMTVRWTWEKCREKGYDEVLKKLFELK